MHRGGDELEFTRDILQAYSERVDARVWSVGCPQPSLSDLVAMSYGDFIGKYYVGRNGLIRSAPGRNRVVTFNP